MSTHNEPLQPDTGPVNYVTDPMLRSELMSRIRSKETKPELIAFAAMRARGVGFQKHYSRVPGNPDLARPRKKLAVFIDGDFWHGRELSRVIAKHGADSAWAKKLETNVRRDREKEELLRSLGWAVLRVWASDITRKSSRQLSLDRIEDFLRSRDSGH